MLEQVINKDGVNVNVGIDTSTLILLIAGVFIGVLAGVVLGKIFTKNL